MENNENNENKKIVFEKKKEIKNKNFENKKINFENFKNKKTLLFLNQLFLEEDFDPEISKILISSLKKKLSSYKQQDVRKKKYCESSFISFSQLTEKLVASKLCCYYCRCNMCIVYENVKQPDQWTLDRLDNDQGHSNSNTVVSCLKCNLERRRKTASGFKFAKQLVIKKEE